MLAMHLWGEMRGAGRSVWIEGASYEDGIENGRWQVDPIADIEMEKEDLKVYDMWILGQVVAEQMEDFKFFNRSHWKMSF